MTLSYRHPQRRDKDKLVEIIDTAFNGHTYTDDGVLRRRLFSADYHYSLGSQDYAEVACIDGEVVGFITAKFNRSLPTPSRVKHWILTALYGLGIAWRSEEGRRLLKDQKQMIKAYKKLSKGTKRKFDVEVELFVVDVNTQGKGIGKGLFTRFIEVAKARKAQSFSLFTDTECNFGFYDAQGMKRYGAEECLIHKKGRTVPLEVYMYGIDFT